MEQDELTRSENEGDCLHFTSVPLLMKAVHQGLQPQNYFGQFLLCSILDIVFV